LPTDRPRPPAPSEVGGRVFERLDRERSDAVRALARASGATLFATLLAAFQSLLARLTGELRLAVGTPSAGRRPAEVEAVVGYFVNPLVMAADFTGGPTFRQALAQVRRTAVEAFAHQEFPFPLLAERLQPRRSPGRSPLFQVMFVLQKAHLPGSEELAAFALGWPGVELDLGGVVLESLPLEQRGAPFELTLMAAEWGERLQLGLQFAHDLFDPTTARRLLGHFTAWLQEVTSHPDHRLDGLGLLRPAERAQLVSEWNDTRLTEPVSGCLHELFAAQAARTPDAVAVVDPRPAPGGRRILTYAGLAAGARGVAQRLRCLGVGPEVRVGLCAERSPEMVTALLGILEAGGAWVPLDPSYPRARLAWLRADSAVPVILTQSHLRPLVDGSGATVVRLDDPGADAEIVGLDDPGAGVEVSPRPPGPPAAGHPDQLAYVIYTSGSTGRPKGAMNAHRGVVNRLLWMKRTYALSPADRVLH
ncbi:MAG: AMP-binding protein, partial [bacterium]|nr:AMP-binding protein [bacterium]